jgi:ABC-type lipoprotein release transport system permease subunit
MKSFFRNLSIGYFLAYRDVKKANIWTTALIVTVMVLTFLNLIVVSGILVGLIEGAVVANRDRYSSDVFISTPLKKNYIENTGEIVDFVKTYPGVVGYSARYSESGKIETNYKNRTRLTDEPDQAGASVAGIDPIAENNLTNISKYIIEGEFLSPEDTDSIVIGANLLYKYTPIEAPGFQTLKDVEVGSKVRLVLSGNTREVTVKGIIKAKADSIDQRVFMVDTYMKKLIGRNDFNVDEISIKLDPSITTAGQIKQALIEQGFDQYAKVQTWEDAQPKFLKDIQTTFALLGNMIGTIGLAVACITIFIIIFVNAITRRRFIGILKGIGINSQAIEISYVIQSLFYALSGILIGAIIVFAFLKPYIGAHPVNFPFSDGILVATVSGTMIRAIILLIATLIAGYIPARIVVKQNTLDAILGR